MIDVAMNAGGMIAGLAFARFAPWPWAQWSAMFLAGGFGTMAAIAVLSS